MPVRGLFSRKVAFGPCSRLQSCRFYSHLGGGLEGEARFCAPCLRDRGRNLPAHSGGERRTIGPAHQAEVTYYGISSVPDVIQSGKILIRAVASS